MPSPCSPPSTHGPLAVVLLYDGLCSFEFGIAAEVFGLARPELGPGWYRFASCPVEAGPLHAQGGLLIQPQDGPDLLEQADMIIIPGWKGIQAEVPEALCQRLRDAYQAGVRLVSICSGAAVLAATGLLDGAEVATHWRYAEALQTRFPRIRVDAGSLYREHQGIFTSAGSAAGIDLLLEIVRRDFGADAANHVARRLVVPAQRRGSQAQYLQRPVPDRRDGPIALLLDQIRSRPGDHWTLHSMAAACAMSRRTFLRRFFDATGDTPGHWVVAERLEAAKGLLSDPRPSIEEVAACAGFGSAHALRHHFRRLTGLPPGEYRAQQLPSLPPASPPADDALAPDATSAARRCRR